MNWGKLVVGGALLGTGIGGALKGWKVATSLITMGAGMVLGGIGSLMNKGPGSTGTSRNTVQPWQVVYGETLVGGTCVYIEETGSNNKFLHQIFVLAGHPSEAVDRLMFDGKFVQLDGSGNSFTPVQQHNVGITSIARVNGVVTVTLAANIPLLQTGDFVKIHNTVYDQTLGGVFPITVLSHVVGGPGSVTFSYLCGGANVSGGSPGQCDTQWPNWHGNVHMEVALGAQTSNPFPGLASGFTMGSGASVAASTTWTDSCALAGMTAVYLCMEYDQNIFLNGQPNISFLMRGHNKVMDPRAPFGGGHYSNNAALCIANFLANQTWGMKAGESNEGYGYDPPYTSAGNINKIDLTQLIAAADICDQAVTKADGTTEPRYTCDGTFTTETSRGEVLQNLLTSCAGRITYVGGKYQIWPGAWYGPSVQIGAPADVTAGAPLIVPNTASTYVLSYGGSSGPQAGMPTAFTDGSCRLVFDGIGGATIEYLSSNPAWTDIEFDAGGATVTIASPGPTALTTVPAAGTEMLVQYQGHNPSHFDMVSGAATHSTDDFLVHAALTLVSGDGYLAPNGEGSGIQVTMAPFDSFAAGPISWRPACQVRDLVNGCKGKYRSPINNYQESDYPAYMQDATHGYTWSTSDFQHDLNLANDASDRRWLDMHLPFTSSPSMAQRIAKIELLRRRYYGTATLRLNLAGYAIAPLDIVRAYLPHAQWYGKMLEAAATRFTVDERDGVLLGTEIDLQETDPLVYAWSTTEELSPYGLQQAALPENRFPTAPGAPTGVTGTSASIVGADGIARSRIITSWAAPADGYVQQGGRIEVQYQKDGDSTWTPHALADPTTATHTSISDVIDGSDYHVRIRSVNHAGACSDWVSPTGGAITVSGQASTLAPSQLTQGGATTGQVLVWNGSAFAPAAAPIKVEVGGSTIGTRGAINLIPGTGISIVGADDGSDDRVNVTINSGAGSSNPDVVRSVPADGAMTWLNQGGATLLDNSDGSKTIAVPANWFASGSNNNVAGLGIAIPASGPWEMYVCVDGLQTGTTGGHGMDYGLILWDQTAAAGDQEAFLADVRGWGQSVWPAPCLGVASGRGSGGFGVSPYGIASGLWLRISYATSHPGDTTNIYVYASQTGLDWLEVSVLSLPGGGISTFWPKYGGVGFAAGAGTYPAIINISYLGTVPPVTGIAAYTATVAVGTVTTGAPGSSASVTDSGAPGAAVFNFTIPQGATGAAGATGATGTTGAAGATGANGAAGATGATGATGAAGSNTIEIDKAGSTIGTRGKVNLIQGSNVTLTVADNGGTGAVDVTIASSAGGGGTTIRTGFGNPNGGDVAPHNMTANGLPTPYTASASSFFSGSFQAYEAFDGGAGSNQYWLGSGSGVDWLQIDLGASAAPVLVSYSVKVNTIPEATRAPKNWTLQGSNNGSSWTTLDTQTNQTAWASGEVRNYSVTGAAAWRYYRVNITANNGDATYTQIAELYLFIAGASGTTGDYYIDTSTRAMYGPLSGSTWPLVGHWNA